VPLILCAPNAPVPNTNAYHPGESEKLTFVVYRSVLVPTGSNVVKRTSGVDKSNESGKSDELVRLTIAAKTSTLDPVKFPNRPPMLDMVVVSVISNL
jgi:hypothetical protein